MHYDLIVIGTGLSGLMAAKTASEAGQKVLAVGKGMGSLCLFSNSIDLLGSLPKSLKMNEGLSQWIKDHPEHPYAKVGLEKIWEALSSFLSLFPPPYSFQAIEHCNSLLPTGAGTFRATYLVPNTMVEGALLKEGNALIVGLKGFKDFYAHYVADQLKCRGTTLSFSEVLSEEINAPALARLMEKKSFRNRIGKEIKKEYRGEKLVGLPAILGIHHPMEVKRDLEEMIGAKVFEIPILPPSIPGLRIYNRLKEWLIQKGSTLLLGYSVTKARIKRTRCEGIEIFHPPLRKVYTADRYLLATGRFIGGGLKATDEEVVESIFNLPVSQPSSREDWFKHSFFNGIPHPIHHAGILTNPSFQPVNEKGECRIENLWIAGSILSHHHAMDEKSREGIEIATGYRAAQKAIEK